MNKIFTIGLLMIYICISSCTSDERMQHQVKQETYSELNENLATYNATFWNTNNVPQTRGFWKKLRGFLFADAGGALLGSVFGGGGALFGAIYSSAVAGPVFAEHEMMSQTTATCPAITLTPDDTEAIEGSALYPEKVLSRYNEMAVPVSNPVTVNCYTTITSSGIGYQHNLILSRIEEAHPNIYNGTEDSEVMGNFIATEMKESDYVIPETEKNILIQKVNSIVLKSNVDSTIGLVTLLKNACPEYSYELFVIDDFTTNIVDLTNNTKLMRTYLNGYLQVIENSNLTDSQKEVLKSSIEVAANSALFWVTE